ncbi:MAG TPA: hypothetical protein DCG75_08350 [Bacteroidales bacterium]|nr:hypothetical protein [Bacteroidales bacterium]
MQKTLVNQIWQHKSTFLRILYHSQGLEEIFWIDINDENKLPEQISIEKFENLKSDRIIKLIETGEEYRDPDDYSEKSVAKWNKHWEVVEFLNQDEPLIFIDYYFHEKCRELANEHQLSRQTTERIVLKYWKRGKSKLGLLPDLINSGGRGKTRNVLNAKRGRPSKYSKNNINIDANLAKQIEQSYKKFYLQVEQASLHTAYLNYLMVKYPSQVKKNDFTKVPTKAQFRYWGEKSFEVQERIIGKKGSKIFNKDFRITTESSVINTIGPGSLFQIDSTKADIELVSAIDRQIPIGGPTLYFVSDVFSRMIVGVLITLEEPSYSIGARALYNTMISKSQLCKEERLNEIEDFEISDEQWPCHYLPDAIVADRAELLGHQSNNIIRDLGITIENTAAYRADLKGVVENHFKVIHTKIKGLKDKRGFKSLNHKQRGVRNARKDALLTLKEYYAIIIKEVLSYNNSKVLESYPLERDMIIDGVSPIPIQLWNWGIQNRSGKLRSNNILNLKQKLLPKEKAKLSKDGILFKHGLYNISTLRKGIINRQLLLQDKKLSVEVSFDPFNLEKIYLHYDSDLIECFVSKSRSPLYINANMWEISAINEINRAKIYKDSLHSISESIESLDFAENIFKEAETKRKKKKSASIKPKNIRENKTKEKELNRQEQIIRDNTAKEVKIIHMKSENKDLSNNEHLNFFRKLMDDE